VTVAVLVLAGVPDHLPSLGETFSPVAVEDHSLPSWRPLLELAMLAAADGRPGAAAGLSLRAEAPRRSVIGLHARRPTELK
jgi:hypothetical protein